MRSEKISVLDLSNAWWERFIGEEKSNEAVQKLITNAYGDGIVLITDRPLAKDLILKHPLPQGVTNRSWSYFGFRFSDFRDQTFSKVIHDRSFPFRVRGITESGSDRCESLLKNVVPIAPVATVKPIHPSK